MRMIFSIGRCPDCGDDILAVCQHRGALLHVMLSFLTAGLWLPVWLVLNRLSPPCICCSCGRPLAPGDVTPLLEDGSFEHPWECDPRPGSGDNFNAYLVSHNLVYYVPTLAAYDGR